MSRPFFLLCCKGFGRLIPRCLRGIGIGVRFLLGGCWVFILLAAGRSVVGGAFLQSRGLFGSLLRLLRQSCRGFGAGFPPSCGGALPGDPASSPMRSITHGVVPSVPAALRDSVSLSLFPALHHGFKAICPLLVGKRVKGGRAREHESVRTRQSPVSPSISPAPGG
jgi:hypothetical protein